MTLILRDYLFMSFHTTTDVMAAEEACRKAGVECRLVQLPSSMGDEAECGTALRVEPELGEKALAVLRAAGITPVASAIIRDF